MMRIRPSRWPLSLVVEAERRHTTDGDLARGLIAEESWAIKETWRRFAPMVITTAERALGSKSEAEDVAQEVFYSVYRKAKSLREPDRLRSFVYSFAVRLLKYELRSRKVRSWLSFNEPAALTELSFGTLDMDSRDLLRRCHLLLSRLAPRDQLVFVLRRMEEMTLEEIAATMGISTSTAKRSMARAVGKLSRWIDADPGLANMLQERQWKP